MRDLQETQEANLNMVVREESKGEKLSQRRGRGSLGENVYFVKLTQKVLHVCTCKQQSGRSQGKNIGMLGSVLKVGLTRLTNGLKLGG